MEQIQKIGIVPLPAAFLGQTIWSSCPIDLGCGLSVQNSSLLVSQVDATIFNRFVAPHQLDAIKSWSICLQHQYTGERARGKEDDESDRLLRYVLAHLRFLAPVEASGLVLVQVDQIGPPQIQSLSPPQTIYLEDCEIGMRPGLQHFEILKSWMPWIVDFTKDHRSFYPLFLSLYFSEKAYLEPERHIRHLFRTVALEALFSSERKVGKKALRRSKKLVDSGADLYAHYRSDNPDLPALPLSDDLLNEITDLRNTVAHGDWPDAFSVPAGSRYNPDFTKADKLREAATCLLAAVWREILNKNLQSTFSSKERMETFVGD